MSWTVPVALYGWIAVVAIAFAVLTPPRAVLLCYFAGWMFLPVASLEALGFFDYSKSTAIPLLVFVAMFVFDGERVARFRPRWLDLPVAVFCAVPVATSLSNGLGLYDGVSAATYQTITWGLPYLTGRIYFSSPEGARQLALAMLAAGLVYAPFCLWEIRMSPQLHATVYGFHQHEWVQTLRGGGYRPMVFMQHGLMVGLWMCAASLVGLALWMSGAQRRMWGIPLWLAVPGLIVTTVLCKSFGAVVLLIVGALALWTMRATRVSLPMALLLCIPSLYVTARVSGAWTGDEMVDAVRAVSAERASSLEFRIDAEEKLRATAAQQPIFGWGGWNRSLARRTGDPQRVSLVTIDSLWIIAFGKNGLVGLASLFLAFLLPVIALWRRCPPRLWDRAAAIWPWALALVLALYALDSMVNAMINPIYFVMAGGLAGFAPLRQRAPARVAVLRVEPRAAVGAHLR
jgi:hypothetical protein